MRLDNEKPSENVEDRRGQGGMGGGFGFPRGGSGRGINIPMGGGGGGFSISTHHHAGHCLFRDQADLRHRSARHGEWRRRAGARQRHQYRDDHPERQHRCYRCGDVHGGATTTPPM